jgi:hypothetical protein
MIDALKIPLKPLWGKSKKCMNMPFRLLNSVQNKEKMIWHIYVIAQFMDILGKKKKS